MLNMIEKTMELEKLRVVFSELFTALDGLREVFGSLLILSGTIDSDNLKNAITSYKNIAREVSSSIPEFLLKIEPLDKGERANIWTIATEKWTESQKAIDMISDPLVQQRMVKFAIANLRKLQQIGLQLQTLECLKPGQSIVNAECFHRFCQGIGFISSLPHPQLPLSTNIPSRIEELDDESDSKKKTQFPRVDAIKKILTEYAFNKGYFFNLIYVDKLIQWENAPLNEKVECRFPKSSDDAHKARAIWIYGVFVKMEASNVEKKILADIRDAILTLYMPSSTEEHKLLAHFTSRNVDGIENKIKEITALINKGLYELFPTLALSDRLENIRTELTNYAKTRQYRFGLPCLDISLFTSDSFL